MDLAVRLLLTYLLHSTVLLGAAWLACRVLRERRLALQEALLRAALVGGFATAGLQVSLGVVPLGGALRLPEPATTDRAAPDVRAVAAAPPVANALPVPRSRPTARHASARPAGPAASGWPTRIVIVPAEPTWAERASAAAKRAGAGYWREALALGWALLATGALARLAVAARRLARLLRGRQALATGPLAPEADAVGGALGLRRPVRISTAPRLSVPLATGILRPEVCLPTRAVVDLGPDEQVALCAHELAHVARRDPAWIFAARLAESVAPLQPLNTWARRRLQDVAECLSDDLAVSVSARPLGLARSLVDVASWTLDDPALLPAAAAGALSARSRLGHRVERLMDPVRRLERPRRLLLPAAALAVLATALVTPVVSGSAAARDAEATPRDAEATPGAVVKADQASTPTAPTPAERPAPAARPAPTARPAPQARPAPEARPSPEARPAPEDRPSPDEHAATAARTEAEARLEEIGGQIAERSKVHEAEMQKLQAEIEAAASRFRPNEAEIRRLTTEIEKAAQELATSVSAKAGHDAGERASSQASREAARRMAELQEEIRRTTGAVRVPSEEIRALAEKTRALAEQARPTEAELAEIRRLSRQVAHESMPDAKEFARMAREAAGQADLARSHAQLASEEAREAIRRAADEMRRAMEEMRRVMDEARRESLQGRPAGPSPTPEAKPATPRP